MTGDFWLVFRPDFLGQRVYVPFLDGHLVEDKVAWVVEPYDGPVMRGPSIDGEGLEAYIESSRSKQEMLDAECAAREQRDPSSISIAELELWGRLCYALERAGLETLGDLCAQTADDLTRDIGLHANSLDELRAALADFGLRLKGD